MIDQRDWMAAVEKHRGDAVVIPAYQAVKGWAEVSRRPRRDFSIDCPSMGKFSSIALGLALAQSDTKVILMDGDGSLLMNLGTLVTIATQAPANFYHFVVQNGVYATTGGQALPAIDRVSFAGMAQAAGYAAAYSFDDLEEFTGEVGRILSEPGPTLICMATTPEPEWATKTTVTRDRPLPQVVRELREEMGAA